MQLPNLLAAGLLCLALASGAATATETLSQSTVTRVATPPAVADLLASERRAPGRLDAGQLAALAARRGTARPEPVRYDASWLAAQPEATGDAEWRCLAEALYFEARGETVAGQFAVAEVILNRRDGAAHPGTICGVVRQGARKGCQFSFVCDGRADRIREPAAFALAGKIARVMLDGGPRALTHGATYFHAVAVRPSWARRFEQTARIGRHLFYRAPVAG
jgi:spore germination cell wall hydrolase CwlJ-like protein